MISSDSDHRLHTGVDLRSRIRSGLVAVIGLLLSGALVVGCADDEERIETFLERGAEYVAAGEDPEAIIEYKNVLQIDPENPAAHEALSLAFLRVEKPREAYWEMSETVRVDPSNVEARLRYGTISAAIGEFDVAAEQAAAVIELDSSNARGYTLRGQAREQRDDLVGAEGDFKLAVESDPDAAAFRFLLGGFYERQEQFEKAEEAYQGLVDVEPSFLALSSLARLVLRDEGRSVEEIDALVDRVIEVAIAAPKEPLEIDPAVEDTGTTSLMHNILREDAVVGAFSLKAVVIRQRGDLDAAIAALEEGLPHSEEKVDLIYQMAKLYAAAGRREDERAMIRRATEEAPDNSNAQLVLSAYLGQQGDIDGALEAARASAEAAPENDAARLRYAEVLVDVGFRDGSAEQITQGREIVDTILTEKPESPEAHFVRAKIELAEDDTAAAKISLETTLQGRPDWAQARYVLGRTLAIMGEVTRARVELESAVELDPAMVDARKLLTQIYAQLGEHEFAIEQGRAYLQARPEDTSIRIVVGQSLIRVGRVDDAYAEIELIPEEARDASALFALGRLDLAYGRIEQGAARLKQAEELSPGNPQVLRSLLAIDRKNDSLDQSVARLAKAREAKPEDPEIAELDGDLKLIMGDAEAARAAFAASVELDPRNVSAQLKIADFEARSGNVEGMLAVVERAAAAVPESADLQYRLAQAYDRLGRRSDAIASYDKSIALDPEQGMAKNNLAYLLAESGGDLDRALELAQQAKEELPDDGNAADTLGWVLLKRGVPSAAIGYLEEAAERLPDGALDIQGVVHNHLAQAYEENSESDKAIATSKAAIGFFDQVAAQAKERGLEANEPEWAAESRARVARLDGAS